MWVAFKIAKDNEQLVWSGGSDYLLVGAGNSKKSALKDALRCCDTTEILLAKVIKSQFEDSILVLESESAYLSVKPVPLSHSLKVDRWRKDDDYAESIERIRFWIQIGTPFFKPILNLKETVTIKIPKLLAKYLRKEKLLSLRNKDFLLFIDEYENYKFEEVIK